MFEDDDQIGFNEFIDVFIESKRRIVTKSRLYQYKRLKTILDDFQKVYKTRLHYDNINKIFLEKFIEYCQEKENHKLSTVDKNIRILKAIMNESFNNGFHTNTKHKSKQFTIKFEKPNAIYLTESELKELEKTEVSERDQAVKDYFLLMAYSGMRIGNMMERTEDDIMTYKGVKMIYFIQSKKNDDDDEKERTILIDKNIQRILDRWRGVFPNDILDKKINKNYINIRIKVIAKDCCPDKAKKISSHTGRRSLCTNEYLKGVSLERIMEKSGHVKKKDVWVYIKATGKEVIAERFNRKRI